MTPLNHYHNTILLTQSCHSDTSGLEILVVNKLCDTFGSHELTETHSYNHKSSRIIPLHESRSEQAVRLSRESKGVPRGKSLNQIF